MKPAPMKANISPFSCYTEGKQLLGDQYPIFLVISFLGFLIAGVVPLILMGPMFCGMVICLINVESTRMMRFEDLFKGFDYFLPGLIASLLYTAAAIVALIPFMVLFFIGIALVGSDVGGLQAIGGLVVFAVYCCWIYVATLAGIILFFACAAIVDRQVDGVTAFKLALAGYWSNVLGVSLTAFAGLLILLVATLMCVIPVLFASPIVVAGHFVLYRKIFGIQKIAPVMANVVH